MPRTRRTTQKAYRKKKSYGRRRRGLNPMRRGLVYNPMPSFVETLQAAPLVTNQGGIFTVAINSIPEYTSYATLYKQFRINSLEVIIVPRFSAFEANAYQQNAFSGATPGLSMARIVTAVNNSAGEALPTSELQLLEDNGCKFKMLTSSKPLKFRTMRPVANVGVTDFGALVPHSLAESKAGRWLDIDSGSDIQHYGISYWVTGNFGTSGSGLAQVADVFYKVSFTLRDPR